LERGYLTTRTAVIGESYSHDRRQNVAGEMFPGYEARTERDPDDGARQKPGIEITVGRNRGRERQAAPPLPAQERQIQNSL